MHFDSLLMAPPCLDYVLIYEALINFYYFAGRRGPRDHGCLCKCTEQVALSGPTLFGQVINNADEIAGRSVSYNSRKYFVLLIITVKRRMTYSCIYFYFVFLPCRENLISKLHTSLHSFIPFYVYYYFLGGLK